MDLDELQSVQSRERQTDTLQQLRASFYREAGEHIEQLRARREEIAEQADDPWNDPQIAHLSDDIDTAEQTVEAIYERRVGKIVKMASLAAADMPTEDDGLTDEECRLFETLVGEIEANREHVEAILDGESPAASGASEHTPADTPRNAEPAATDRQHTASEASDTADKAVGAADLMGSADESALPDHQDGGAATERESVPDAQSESSSTTDSEAAASPGDSTGRPTPEEPSPAPEEMASTGGETASTPDIERETIKITADVGEILGVDQRSYDLSSEDVVTLPKANADPLLDRDAAERLE